MVLGLPERIHELEGTLYVVVTLPTTEKTRGLPNTPEKDNCVGIQIPVSDHMYSDEELRAVSVHIADEQLAWLRSIADRRKVSLDQVVRYLLNVCQNASRTATERTSTGPGRTTSDAPYSRILRAGDPDVDPEDSTKTDSLLKRLRDRVGNESTVRSQPRDSGEGAPSVDGERAGASGREEEDDTGTAGTASSTSRGQSDEDEDPPSFFELVTDGARACDTPGSDSLEHESSSEGSNPLR